jgi:hypothetical protein
MPVARYLAHLIHGTVENISTVRGAILPADILPCEFAGAAQAVCEVARVLLPSLLSGFAVLMPASYVISDILSDVPSRPSYVKKENTTPETRPRP